MIEVVWYPVVRLPLEQDLTPFLNYLDTLQIRHYVSEESGEQQLWINDESRRVEVADKLTEWLSGNSAYQAKSTEADANKSEQAGINFLQTSFSLAYLFPVTLVTIILGFIGYLLIFLDGRPLSLTLPFVFQAIGQNGEIYSLSETLAKGDFWRLLTPIFLHFSLLHIIFNSVILWEFGRRIEIAKGSLYIALLIVIIGVIANVAQYMAQANTLFGGLSGVVYGAIGYIAVYQQYIQHPVLQFNKAAIAFFIVWLLLGVFGIIDFFISGSIANAAHIAGLLAGAAIGLFEANRDKAKLKH